MTARRVSILAIALWTAAVLAAQHVNASEKFDGFLFIMGEEIDKLCRSLREFGFTNPILVDGERHHSGPREGAGSA